MGRTLLQRIEAFLKLADMPPSVFGRQAARDPRLVSDMRGGREIGSRLSSRIEHFMNIYADQLQNGRAKPLGDRRTMAGRSASGANWSGGQ